MPGRTAYRVALRRAAHQLLDRPLVLDDPVAIPILGRETASRLRADPSAFERGAADAYLRAFLVARARFAEDHLEAARAAGVHQYVILGAGLDTFAYRQPAGGRPLRIWEVDHPDTQAWKRELLAAAEIPVPENLTWAAVDFERDSLAERLAASRFDASAGAVFTWLGVTMYLTVAAIDATLEYVARTVGPHGGITFDYAVDRARLTPPQQAVFDRLAALVEAAGEPWRTTFEPETLAARVRELGFSRSDDAGPDALNERYFAGRTDGLRVGGLARIMWAAGVEACDDTRSGPR